MMKLRKKHHSFVALCIAQLVAISPILAEPPHENEVAVTEESLPREPNPGVTQTGSILVPNAKGLVLVGNEDEVEADGRPDVRGLKVVGLRVPGGTDQLALALDPYYRNRDLRRTDILKLKREISRYFKDHGRPLVVVDVPEQDVTDGVLQLLVIEGKLSKVVVKGHKYTNPTHLEEYMSLQPNEEIDEDILVQDLNFINRNPFRRVDVIYAPGEKPGTTEIQLLTQDKYPFRVYIGAENTGVESTGRQRWIGGFNKAYLFGIDDLFSFQVTGSYDFHKFRAYTAQYNVYLPNKNVLELYGGYSSVYPDIISPVVIPKNHGSSIQASMRYLIPLPATRNFLEEISIGGDFKRTNNNVEFSGTSTTFTTSSVNLTQIVLAYNFNLNYDLIRTSFNIEGVWSPGKWIPDQHKADYQGLRPGAKPNYLYMRTSLASMMRLPGDFSLSALLRGQLSSTNLLPSEQFGIGGYNTVRGYEERQLNMDRAFLASGELRTPAISVFGIDDALQFLGFIDYGYGRNHNLIAGELISDHLVGAGPGLRYAIDPYLSVRFDWGFKLYKQARFGGGDSMIHFGVILTY